MNLSVNRKKNSINILLVDDMPANLTALAAVLDDPRYHLTFAQSGFEALEAMAEDEFALVLLDVQMPGIDGFETAQKIRQIPSAQSTPIVFVTAIHKDDKYARRGYELGGIDYLFKPLDTDILRAKVSFFVDHYLRGLEIRELEKTLKELTAMPLLMGAESKPESGFHH